MKPSFFTTGQFAQLCETTKETLRHYNNVGIIKPEKIGENGYQYYSYRQIFDFYLIQVLRHAGCSLSLIDDYIKGQTQDDFKDLLNQQLKALMVEKQNIEKREQILKESIQRFEIIEKQIVVNRCYIKDGG